MNTKTIFGLHHRFLTLIFLWSHLNIASAQNTSSVFEHITALPSDEIELEVDLTDIVNNKNTNNYFPGKLKLSDDKIYKVDVRSRGKFRRRICEIPPLKIKFSKKELRASQLDTFNEVKLVTPCTFTPEGEALLFKEYLAYKMYETLDPTYSVRARLVSVKFTDKHVETQKPVSYCILLEHEEELSARLGGKMVESYNLKMDTMDTQKTALTAMFEYMIGNTDWDISSFRNIYLFQANEGGKIKPIPFDFDFSGLVNAPYAIPTTESGLRNVQDRYLMARDIPTANLTQAVQTIKSKKEEIDALFSIPNIPTEINTDANQYINSFYNAVESKDKVPDKMKYPMR